MSATAASASLASCRSCDLLCRLKPLPPGAAARCPRCGARVRPRKPESLRRTVALLLAAAIFYVPANIYPVMKIESFGTTSADTILQGVKELVADGSWPIGLLLFFASFCVPTLKLFGLACLVVSVRRGSRWRPRQRTVWYRLIETIGRWSMLDIFTLSIMVALLEMGNMLTVVPGIGAGAFAAVVVLTMFAAGSFDPRLVWDGAARGIVHREGESA